VAEGGAMEVQHEEEEQARWTWRPSSRGRLSEVLCDDDYNGACSKTHKKYKEVLREVYFDNKKKENCNYYFVQYCYF